jgi:capsular exopolysaccharide synthesis family protein
MLNIFRRRDRAVPDARHVSAAADQVDEHLVSLVAPASFAAERYRVLRHTVEQLHKEDDVRIVAITSPTVGDGKTTTSINLAGALAQATDARVLVVDADLRRGQVRRDLALNDDGEPGLADAILDVTLSIKDVVRRCEDFNLFVLPAGDCPAAPYEALRSPRVGELLQAARLEYDHVIVDTAPLLPVPDTRMIAKWVDGFFMVVAANRTRRRMVEEAQGLIDSAKMLGLVFNGDDCPISSYSSYGYGLYRMDEPGDGGRAGRWRWIRRTGGRPDRRAS